MRRTFFNALSAVSLLLCILTVILWARSWWFIDEWRVGRTRPTERSDWILGTTWGQMRIGRFHEQIGNVGDRPWSADFEHVHARGGMNDVHGPLLPSLDRYRWSGGSGGRRVEFDTVRLPLWLVALLFAVVPALWVRRAIPALVSVRRSKSGRCTACGYLLTGNTSGACPECGQLLSHPGPTTSQHQGRA